MKRRVETEPLANGHVIRLGMFFDGEGAALCGKKPFPERWTMPVHPQKPLCQGCLTAIRKQQK